MWEQTAAIVAATIIGPLSAVCISLWIQNRSQLRERKTILLRYLVGTRNLRASPEYGLAISLIPIEFAKNQRVISARDALLAKANDPAPETDQKIREIDNLISDLVAEMLSDLGFKTDHSKVRALNYTPSIVGWRDNLYVDSLFAQLRIANELAKSSYVTRKIGEHAGAVSEVDQPELPFPSLEKTKD